MLRLRPLALLCICALAFTACDSDDPVDDLPPDDEGLLDDAVANPGMWFFVQPDGMECRDGSATGFGVRFQEGAENLVIYLEGGGACFNEATCAQNPSSFSEADFITLRDERGNVGLFNPGSENPIGDWNAVYVPYCTGDVHGGSNPGAIVPGVSGLQQFVGHMNVERVLDVLDLTLEDDPAKLLLTGASAGGFGTLVNFVQVADRFDASEAYLINDSGPIFFADDVLSPALAGGFNTLYLLEDSLPDDATDAGLFESDGLQGIYDYYDTRYPNATFGLSSYLQDQTIRNFFSFGQPDPITGEEFEAGLEDIRAMLPDSWGTYYAAGDEHVFLPFPDRYFGSVNGTMYTEWLDDIMNGTATDVAPEPTRVAGK